MGEWSLKLREALMPEDAGEREEEEQWLEEAATAIKADPEHKALAAVMEAMDSFEFQRQMLVYGLAAVTSDGQVLPVGWKAIA